MRDRDGLREELSSGFYSLAGRPPITRFTSLVLGLCTCGRVYTFLGNHFLKDEKRRPLLKCQVQSGLLLCPEGKAHLPLISTSPVNIYGMWGEITANEVGGVLAYTSNGFSPATWESALVRLQSCAANFN